MCVRSCQCSNCMRKEKCADCKFMDWDNAVDCSKDGVQNCPHFIAPEPSSAFWDFCASHSCCSDCKERSDYCPIAEAVRAKYGVIRGGYECEVLYEKLVLKNND